MGVRLALGTTPLRLRGSLLRQCLLPLAAGTISGIAGAALTGRFLQSLVEGAKPIDPVTFAFSILFIFLIASTSMWAATRRIAALNIIEILAG
jgi:ABC-type antimicrobial peptide transport system permease subunit